jgi:hypothetical protein
MTRNRMIRFISVLIYSIGTILGMAVFASIIFGDFEAARFDAAYRLDEPLHSVRCPVVMTAEGTGAITASITNTRDKQTEFRIRTRISQGSATLMREENTTLTLEPGETQKAEWTVTPDDAAYGRLILAKVRLFGKYPLPSREGSCGILFIDLTGFSGSQVFTFMVALALLSIAIGVGLWFWANRPLKELGMAVLRAMGGLAGCIIIGTIIGLFGYWLVGGIVLVISFLLIGTIIGHFLTRSDVMQRST